MDFFLDFAAAEDMIAILGVQVRRRLGFGIKTNIHISKLQIEGKVRIGIKFSKSFPFITRFRLCFETAPYVQMNARPLSAHGLNVSELPLIAGWMERLIADVFEQSLVEPNMLVVDVEKLLNSKGALQDSLASVLDECLHVKGKAAVAVVKLDILEATDLKPSDLNGLADPYVVGSFASYSFKTKVHKKTLKPKWYEKVEIPIYSWEVTSLLILHVRDKDQFIDDELGFCELDLSLYRDGQEHDLWINLSDVKMGRLHLNFVITEVVSSSESSNHQVKGNNDDTKEQKVELLEERFEIIDLGKGENEGGFLSVVSPGQQMRTKSWQQRHRISKKETSTNQKEVLETVCQETSRSTSSSDSAKIETENKFSTQEHPNEPSLSSVLEVKPLSRNDCNHQVTGNKATVKLNLETSNIDVAKSIGEPPSPIYLKGHDESELDSPSEHNVRRKAKGLLKQAEKAAQHIKSSFNRRASRKRYEDENIKDSSAPGTPY
ncbi:hypothetical protein KP509_12G018500 [Ceratopteris richardii]|nr:hypothetical protein KP509_12G018500 [Ceratopteris richardii]